MINTLGLFLLLCFSQTNRSYAHPVYVASPQVSESELELEMRQNPKAQTFTQYRTQHSVPTRLAKKLKYDFTQAQHQFLSGSLSQSLKYFSEVTQLALSADWKPAQRKIIFDSYLRQAQLIDNQNEKNSLIQQAFHFAPDLQPDKDLFPPPLQSLFKKTKKQALILTKPWPKPWQAFQVIFINGKSYPLNLLNSTGVRLPQVPARITLVSNQFHPQTEILSPTQWEQWRPEQRNFVSGTCQNPTKDFPRSKGIQFVGLFPGSCKVTSEEQSLHNMPATLPDLKITRSYKPDRPQQTKTLDRSFQASTTSPSPRPFYKRTWFWATVTSAVVLGAVWYHQQEKSKSEKDGSSSDSGSETTSKEGF